MASSRSASSNTMNGALPPNSIVVRLRVGAHCSSSSLPTAVLPVKLSLRTSGLPVSSAPISCGLPTTTLKQPAGKPARSASSAMASADSGVSSAGLTTTVQPAASAGATLRAIIALGKFQGVIAATTPTGWRMQTARVCGVAPENTSPSARLACSANHSMNDAPYWISPRDSNNVLPCSAVINTARSSAAPMVSSYQRRRMLARSLTVVRRHSPKARLAASMARRVSAAFAVRTSAIVAPVAGLLTASTSRPSPASQAPST